jgi:pantoate--beta-alanine ligase
MRVINEINSLRDILFQYKIENKSIGLVPTMGALHNGHTALIEESVKECDITVCSIYVNPTQFNKSTDLVKYPKTINNDLLLLEKSNCDIVFCPDNKTMYPYESNVTFDFGTLDKVMEGEFRPGHFSGVGLVVSKLLNIVQPNNAYFGQKDLQQFAVINKLAKELLFDTKIKCVPIIREENGLALSSRNMRLTNLGKNEALVLYESLIFAKKELTNGESITEIRNKIKLKFAASIAELEYFEVVEQNSLEAITNITKNDPIAICIAGYVENVRLIDNILLNE